MPRSPTRQGVGDGGDVSNQPLIVAEGSVQPGSPELRSLSRSCFHFELTRCSLPPQVFFDIEIGGEKAGRVVFGLYGDVVPKVRTWRGRGPAGWSTAHSCMPATIVIQFRLAQTF
jgi:hypothetical protein